jgi:translin
MQEKSVIERIREVIEHAAGEIDEIESIREITIKETRDIIKLSRAVIHGIHTGADIDEKYKALRMQMLHLRSLCEKTESHKIIPLLEDAFQEFAEACIFLAIVRNERVPEHKELGITPTAYLLAMGDVLGELRRFVLNNLKKGNIKESEKVLEIMEELYTQIEAVDYPSAIIPIRHKVDVARALMDKTRSDVAYAVIANKARENYTS